MVHRVNGDVAFGGERTEFDEPLTFPGRTHFANRCEAGVHAGTEVGGVLLELANKFLGFHFDELAAC